MPEFGTTLNYREINDWFYSNFRDILNDLKEQRRDGVDEATIALEVLDLAEQTLNAIKLDLGAI